MIKKELAVVMPVYNEEEIIETVIKDWVEELTKLNISFQIHPYNDGSKDGSLKKLQELEKSIPELIVHDKPNSGHGPTILKAYVENSDFEWVFQLDSDNEMSASSFKELWDSKSGNDFIIGQRTNRDQPLSRKIVSFISRLIIKVFYSSTIYDVNSPFRLMRTEKFKPVFEAIPSYFFAPNIIISGLAGYLKFKTLEVPVNHINRQTGEVSIKKWKLFKFSAKSMLQTIRFRFTLKKYLL